MMKKTIRNLLTLFFLLFICVAPAHSQENGETLTQHRITNILELTSSGDVTKMHLTQALERLEEKYDVSFMYNSELVRGKMVTMNNRLSEDFRQELLRLLVPLEFTWYPINNRTLAIISNEEEKKEEDERFQETVRGTVTDAETGEALPGVNVIVEGTTVGTSTNSEGQYELSVPSLAGSLIFTYVGYETLIVSMNGENEFNVELTSQAIEGEEMVVTAFGVARESRQLSHSVQNIEGETVAAVGNTNVVNSLQGKIAGVTVRQTSGAPGSSHDITIRGYRSLLGDNEPLYVIDGLPVVSGSRTIDINPGDIESINVLKGPTAAALYGLRASNGAIIIETKKGSGISGDGPQISFETNYNVQRLSRYPDVQKTYMQGENGEFNPFSAHSWGPRIDEMGTYINQLGEEEEAAFYDNARAYFRSGGISNSNISISNTIERGNYAINVGFTDHLGIMNYTGLQRTNLKVAGGYDLFDDLRVNTSISYINTNVDEQPTGASSNWWAVFAVPVSYDLAGKPIHEPGNPYKQINFRGQHDNLIWMNKYNYTDNETSRILGNVNVNYTPADWLMIDYRLGMDGYTRSIKTVFELGSGPGRTDPPSGGRLSNNMQEHRQLNSNLMATLNQDISEDVAIEFTAGNEFYDIRTRNVSISGNDFVIGGFHHVSNAASQNTGESLTRRRVVGFYGNLNFSWKNSIYVNATGRNDIVSNMPSENRSFFYPSLGLGVVFSDFFSIPDNILSYGKFRASVAEVGQAGPVYATRNVFNSGAAIGGFAWPYEGLNAFSLSSQLNSSDLRTENTRTYEIGLDLRFFEGRLGLDYTFYDSRADGQIYRVPIALSTGYSSELRNAGEMSVHGHEIMLNITPVLTSDFAWNFTTNFTTYTNKVVKLAEGIEQLELGGFRTTQVAVEGEEYPALRGSGYARDPATGEVVVDGRETLPNGTPNPRYGMPLQSTQEIILGSANPDFEVGFINSFSYKNLTLSAQLDWRQGGKFSSGQNRLGKLYGVNKVTESREEDYVFQGKKGFYEDGELVVVGENDITIKRGQTFYQSQDAIRESNVYETTYLRLREIKLSFDFSGNWLNDLGIRSASIYLVGTNLWTKADVPNFDPEMFNNNATEQYNSYPQAKSFGGGIRVTM